MNEKDREERKRISELADMICQHLCRGNHNSAMQIAQHLRRITGFELRRLPDRKADENRGESRTLQYNGTN